MTHSGLPCWSCQLLVKVQAELMYLMEKDTLPRLKQHKAFVEYFEKVGGWVNGRRIVIERTWGWWEQDGEECSGGLGTI